MDVCLEILREQIKALKFNYYSLIGRASEVLEFSNYTLLSETDVHDKSNAVKFNREIKQIYDDLTSIRDNIYNL